MKKTLKIISATLALSLLLCGCNKIEDKIIEQSSVESQEDAQDIKEEVEATLAQRDRTFNTSTDFVFDDAKVLSDSDYSQINEYTAWLSKAFKLNIAVAITSDLADQTQEEYAAAYYKELYGSSNGILFLVNNDTGDDYILRKGVPSLFIENADIETLFLNISPLLVTGKYKEAINQTLELIELSLPEFAIDRTNSLEKAEILSINDKLYSSCSDGESLSVIYVGNIGEKDISDYANEQAEKYLDDSNSALMVVCTETGEFHICANGSFSGLSESQESIKDSIAQCLSGNDDKISFDYSKAADIFVKFAGK